MSDSLPAKVPPGSGPEPVAEPYGAVEAYALPVSTGRNRRRWVFLRRYWWVPVLTVVVALGGALSYVLLVASPMFVSFARMWETEKLRLPEGTAFAEDAQNYFGTQVELLRSDKLAQGALARLQASGTNAVPRDKNGRALEVQLKIVHSPNSTVFVVQGSSSNPTYTQAYLNALMEEYLAYKRNVRKIVSGDTLASISDQVLRLERELKAAQDALTTFQRTNNLAILEEEARVAGGYLARLKTQRSDLELEAQLLKATVLEQEAGETGTTNATGSLVEAIRGTSSSAESSAGAQRQTAFRELELLKAERARLSKYFRPKHPDIVKLDADIERAQKLIELFHRQNREQLATARQAIDMKLTSVEASIREWEGKVVQANARIAEAERLKFAVSRSQSLYDRLIVLLQNVDISRNIDQETLTILDPASPAVRSYRQEARVVGLALFVGVVLGLGMVLLVELRDDRFNSAAEVNESFGDSLVGQVPEVPELRHQPAPSLLLNGSEPHVYAESYRSLRSALLFLPCERQRPRILLITSALAGEGKSTVAANLARSLALGGSRVLLIDGDLRKGRLHEMLGKPAEPGLVDLLQASTACERAVQTDGVPNFCFLPRGSSAEYPGDLLLGPALEELLARWRQEFDYVLIDSCPVFAADDVTTLAPKVDGTLFVVRNRFSRARVVREALELLAQRQARVLGVVFNRSDPSAHSYYYYKDTGYEPAAKPA